MSGGALDVLADPAVRRVAREERLARRGDMAR